MISAIDLKNDWKELLKEEFNKDYMVALNHFLEGEIKKNKIIYPSNNEIFTALNLTPFEKVKVVIIGQDPYHGANQAHGLSFSVKNGVAIPPSLRNIYKELKNDLNVEPRSHGELISWAKQGVLLLNAVLTVEAEKAASHQGKGWEIFTDKIVQILNAEKKNLVFVLWGAFAQKKGASLDESKHLVLKAPHPSPLSASRGFFGGKYFSKINQYLLKTNQEVIDWEIK